MRALSILPLVIATIGASVGLAPASAQAALPGPSETALVSVSTTLPPTGGDGPSAGVAGMGRSSISADGRYVAFASLAKNLAGPVAARINVYVRDLQTNSTRLVSGLAGGTPDDDDYIRPVISDDGGEVAFFSSSTDLVPGTSAGAMQAYVWHRDTGTVEIASVSDGPTPVPADIGVNSSIELSLSGDGESLAFASFARNLTSTPTGGRQQIYVRDLVGNTTSLASVTDSTLPFAAEAIDANRPSLSRDGSRVAFSAYGPLTTAGGNDKSQVYVRDLDSQRTVLVSGSGDNSKPGNADSTEGSISADGTRVAFQSLASDLTDPPTKNAGLQVWLRDLRLDTVVLVSAPFRPGVSVDPCEQPVISRDGQKVAFVSMSQRLTADGGAHPSGIDQVFIRDVEKESTQLVSRNLPQLSAGNLDSVLPAMDADGSTVSFSSLATDLTSETLTGGRSQVFVRNVVRQPVLERVGGSDRYSVSAAVSAATFAPQVPVAIVASGAVFSDALAAAPLSNRSSTRLRTGGPVLLTQKDRIPDAVANELTRLQPAKILLLGGVATVSNEVETLLKGYSTMVTRIAGADRYEVSAAIAKNFTAPPVAYVASGAVFPDALSASAAAGYNKGPILLTTADRLPVSVSAELRRMKPGRIVVLGGTSTVSDQVLTELQGIAPASRLGGADRYVVSAAVSQSTFLASTPTVYIASGAIFSDALSASGAAIERAAPILLVGKDTIPPAVAAELTRLKPTRIIVMGGPNSVSERVYESLRPYLSS